MFKISIWANSSIIRTYELDAKAIEESLLAMYSVKANPLNPAIKFNEVLLDMTEYEFNLKGRAGIAEKYIPLFEKEYDLALKLEAK